MNVRRIFTLLALTLCLSSCGTAFYTKVSEEVRLGMTKSEVTNILGKGYKVTGSYYDNDGDLVEVLEYKRIDVSSSYDKIYSMHFKNNVLVEWFRDKEYAPRD